MLSAAYLDAMKRFEGFAPQARWDYAQNSNGYGTKARYAGEVIDKAEAERRFADAVGQAADAVDRFAPGLDEGTRAALTSLTYNAGTAWMQNGLGDAVAAGDMDKARSLFVQYNKAGGAVVEGLAQRRLDELAWFGANNGSGQTAAADRPLIADAQPVTQPNPLAPHSVQPDVQVNTFAASPDSDSESKAPILSSNLDPQGIVLSLLNWVSGPTASGQSQSRNEKSLVAGIQLPRVLT